MTHLTHFICGQKKRLIKSEAAFENMFVILFSEISILYLGFCHLVVVQVLTNPFVWPRCLKLGEGKSAQMFCTLLLLLNSLLVLGQWKKNAYDLSLAVVIQLCKRSAKSPSFLRIPVGHFSCTTFLQLKVLSLWDNLYETLRTKSETQVV